MSYDVAVIGCGRVGLPLALAFADHGLRTLGRRERRRAPGGGVRRGGCRSTSRAPTRSCSASTSPGPRAPPTPRRPTRSSSRSARRRSRTSRSTCATSARSSTTCCPCCAPGHLLVLRSTIAPRTTEFVAGYIEKHLDLEVGRDVFVAHVPERIAAGRFFEEIGSLPCIVGGVGEASGEAAGALFEPLGAPIVQTTPGRGRAGEDLDQHPALRDVRAPQPADDGVRAVRRERLRGHRAHQPRLPARRDAAAGLHGGDVPAQGLHLLRGALARAGHAARRLARARVGPALHRRGAQAPARVAARTQGRGPRPGLQGRHRRRARLARRTSSSACSSASWPTWRSTIRTWPRRRSPSTTRSSTPTRWSSRPTTASSATARCWRAIADSAKGDAVLADPWDCFDTKQVFSRPAELVAAAA